MKKITARRLLASILTFAMIFSILPLAALGVQTQATSGSKSIGEDIAFAQSITVGSNYRNEMDPSWLIDEGGLTGYAPGASIEDVKHTLTEARVWHMEANPGAKAWLKFDFGKEILVDQIYIWNHNRNKDSVDRMMKDIEIYTSLTGADESWEKLDGSHTIAAAKGDGQACGYQSAFAIEKRTRFVQIKCLNAYNNGQNYWSVDKVLFGVRVSALEKLQEKYTQAQDFYEPDYTPESWENLSLAKTAAKKLLDTTSADEAAVLAAAQALADAMAALKSSREWDNYMKLWYDEPGNNAPPVSGESSRQGKGWRETALPIGNGNLGGMVFGMTETERVQVNELTLWSGGANSVTGYAGGNIADRSANLKPIQEAMFAGKPYNANLLLGNQVGSGAYQDLGSIWLAFDGKAKVEGTPKNYRRELDMNDGVSRVSYTNAGTHFEREYFCSNPGNVMAIRLTADQTDALAFNLKFEPNMSGGAKTNVTTTAENGVITCQGQVTSSQMQFATQLKVIAPNATITYKGDGTMDIAGGEDIVILMSAGTNYDITEADNIKTITDFEQPNCDYLDDNDPFGDATAAKALKRVEDAATLGYEKLLARHVSDYQEIFGRVSLDLGDTEKADTPTDDLLRDYNENGRNGYLEMLLFQMGRYLLMSSSRDSVLANNLQGIWNDRNDPNWNADYHLNVNLQMNYWPAFVTNMAETADPLVSFMNSLRKPGNVTAREHFGTTNGWVANTEVSPFGKTGPGSAFDWGWTPGSGAWLCENIWEYWEFTKDITVLENIYPIIKEGAQFWLEYLVEDPRTRIDGVAGTGELVTAPAGSSEHGPIGVGTTYDMSLAYMVMSYAVEAAEVQGIDTQLKEDLQAALARMKPFQIGDSGQIKEWREESTYGSMPGTEKQHRHLSHMLGFHPGNLITQAKTPELYDAAVKTLEFRGSGISAAGSGGWSLAQKINLWARTGQGDTSLAFVESLFMRGMLPNLLDHVNNGTYQIEGNGGATSGMAEMLIQSHQGYIEPLPALPGVWSDGSYSGLMARGNFEVDVAWKSGVLTDMKVGSGSGGECVVHYPNIAGATVQLGSSNVKVEVRDLNTIAFETNVGEEYTITGFQMPAPTNLKAARLGAEKVSLTWDALEGAKSYNVYRKTENSQYVHIATALKENSFVDNTAIPLSATETYTYVVAAADAAGLEGKRSLDTAETFGIDDSFVPSHDERITYSTNWSATEDSQYVFGKAKLASIANESATFTFEGTGIEYATLAKNDMGIVEIYIDDQKAAAQDLYRAAPNKLVYRITGLEKTSHTIKLVCTGTKNPSATGDGAVSIDYFRILTGNEAPVYTPTPVSSVTVKSETGVTLLSDPAGSLQMAAAILPLNADDGRVSWSVSAANGAATKLATIDENGLLTAGEAGVGAVTVTATALDGSNEKDTCTVEIATKRGTADPENIAVGCTVTMEGGAENPAHITSNMTDGSYATRMALSSIESEPIYVKIDLGSAREFNRVEVLERLDRGYGDHSRITNIVVEIPDDAGSWTEIGSVAAPGINEGNDKERFVVKLERTVTAEIVRIAITPVASGEKRFAVWETEVYSPTKELVVADKTALCAALSNASGIIEADFAESDKTWGDFETARDAAVLLANNLAATELEISSTTTALNAAMEGVTAKKVLQSLTLKTFSALLPVGRTAELHCVATYDRGQPVQMPDGVAYVTKSGKEDILTVDAQGHVTGLGGGTDTVVALLDGQQAEFEFTVLADASNQIAIIEGAGGTIQRSAPPPYKALDSLTLTAIPNSSHTFAYWLLDGRRITQNPLTITIGQTISAEACFAQKSSGGGGASGTTTTTEKNADGSISTIVTDKKTGTVVETARYADGSKVVTTTPKDGKASSVVTVSKTGEKTTVTIPTSEKPAAGMVAVIVNADGSKQVIKTSVATAAGMRVTITDGARMELLDNTKTFTDVMSGDWYKDAVTFATSRELFNGTAANSFAPNAPMTRAMLMTVLYRYEGASVKGEGDLWYADSMAWAKEIALSDGTMPDGSVTREQLATMLYRYAKPTEAATADTARFEDGDKVSDFASEAMNWAIATGLITGKANNLLDPRGNATRAEVATILMRFCETIAK